ncbi:hypothetical protein [Thioalkalivibrio sp. HK1]|nr:hypothetical protein [Thioalkalivibrio sp. HK1]
MLGMFDNSVAPLPTADKITTIPVLKAQTQAHASLGLLCGTARSLPN